ncbi:MAG: nuclear transport factor 2 family protein [Actinomycetota bacterium]|nr:nuclear transport factor 2 family protein [Actinomycetota bacterium]
MEQVGTGGRDLVEEMARRFASGDRAGAAALFHPGIRIEQPASLPHGGRHEGPDGVARMGAELARHWDRSISNPRISGRADWAVQVTEQRFTAKTTGRSVTMDVVELFAFSEGLISEIRVFPHDTHAMMGTLDPSS